MVQLIKSLMPAKVSQLEAHKSQLPKEAELLISDIIRVGDAQRFQDADGGNEHIVCHFIVNYYPTLVVAPVAEIAEATKSAGFRCPEASTSSLSVVQRADSSETRNRISSNRDTSTAAWNAGMMVHFIENQVFPLLGRDVSWVRPDFILTVETTFEAKPHSDENMLYFAQRLAGWDGESSCHPARDFPNMTRVPSTRSADPRSLRPWVLSTTFQT